MDFQITIGLLPFIVIPIIIGGMIIINGFKRSIRDGVLAILFSLFFCGAFICCVCGSYFGLKKLKIAGFVCVACTLLMLLCIAFVQKFRPVKRKDNNSQINDSIYNKNNSDTDNK